MLIAFLLLGVVVPFNPQFRNDLDSFRQKAPDAIDVVWEFGNDAEADKELLSKLKVSNRAAAAAITSMVRNPVENGNLAILDIPSTSAEWAKKNGPKYGVHANKENPYIIAKLGEDITNNPTGEDLVWQMAAGMRAKVYNNEESFPIAGPGGVGVDPSEGAPVVNPDSVPVVNSDSWVQQTQEYIKDQEGFELTMYQDGEYASGGWGHNDSSGVFNAGDTVTQEQANEWFEEDWRSHYAGATVLENFGELTPALQMLLVDFVYNIGANAFGAHDEPAWPKLKAAIEARNWDAAADEVIKDWDNVGRRRRDPLVNALLTEEERFLS